LLSILVPPHVLQAVFEPLPGDCATAGAVHNKVTATIGTMILRMIDIGKPQLKRNGKTQIQYANE
jgi:hypothetical protein